VPPDGRSEARDWLDRARGCLALARQPKPMDAFWADLCYLAQQAAEKALKAVYHNIAQPHRFTHDLEELAQGLARHGLEVPQSVQDAIVLTRYAVETRYPGTSEPVTHSDYRRAIELAEATVTWAERAIAASDPQAGSLPR
jgi:HEPN domain-containing protein